MVNPKGFSYAGIKKGKIGVGIIKSNSPCPAAGVFTKNRVKSIPVLLSKKNINNKIGAIVANSGNANVYTGKNGIEAGKKMIRVTSDLLGLREEEILLASTGIIGREFPIKEVEELIRNVCELLPKKDIWSFARSIMTTDTFPKVKSSYGKINDKTFTVTGISKGAGMIGPNMGTMLSFILTDIRATSKQLGNALRKGVSKSFNMVVVDGDQSPSDCVFILASGESKCKFDERIFQRVLDEVLIDLARQIAKDGEGSSKFIEVRVSGARSSKDAEMAAKCIARSSLVKTAIYGSDPNWGRVAIAAGYSGAYFSPENLSIRFKSKNKEVLLLERGEPIIDEKILEEARNILLEKEIVIEVDLGEKDKTAIAWGCDLTEEYVKINSEYTT
ncbi:MAG: bifunctional ornithine acetyltransferase/N-acetylglutamate synthase [Candidatus Hydrothermarchaeota archaeon]